MRRTPEGKAKAIWWNLVGRTGGRENPRDGCYAGVENRFEKTAFLQWCVPALEVWAKDHELAEASIDRIDEDGHYEPGNVRIVSKAENSRRRRRNKNVHAPPGMAWCGGNCQKYKPRNDFYINETMPHGLYAYCKTCWGEYQRKRRRRQRE